MKTTSKERLDLQAQAIVYFARSLGMSDSEILDHGKQVLKNSEVLEPYLGVRDIDPNSLIDLQINPIDVMLLPVNNPQEMIVVSCRESLFEKLATQLKRTMDAYGIPIIFDQNNPLVSIQTWQVISKVDQDELLVRLQNHYQQHGLNVAIGNFE